MLGAGSLCVQHDRRPVLEHVAGNLGRQHLIEVVVLAVDARVELGGEDPVVAVERAAGRADLIAPFEIGRRLDFLDAIDARRQVR